MNLNICTYSVRANKSNMSILNFQNIQIKTYDEIRSGKCNREDVRAMTSEGDRLPLKEARVEVSRHVPHVNIRVPTA